MDRSKPGTKPFDLARVAIGVAPLLAVGVFALLEWGNWGSEADDRAEGGEKELAVWQFLITAQVLVWGVLAGFGLRALGELDADAEGWFAKTPGTSRTRWRRETTTFLLFTYGLIALLLVVGGLAGLRNPYVFDGQAWKIPLLHAIAGAAALPFLVVLKRIQLCAAEVHGWSTTARDIERIHALRKRLRSATASLGTVIALAVIATGALNEAVEAASLEPLPDTFVLVYGAWFTGVLAAIYLYVFTALEARARDIMENAAPLPDPSPELADVFSARTRLRSELSAELEIGGDARQNLEGLIAILSPLVGALLTQLGGL